MGVQVYLYDINALLQPLLRPRQLLPYAIVTYTLGGLVENVDSIEPLTSDVPSQLRHIIQRINAKADVSQRPAGDVSQRTPADNLSRVSCGMSAQTTASVSVTGSGVTKPTASTESTDANLQRVIAQINARLESQERSKQLALQNMALIGATASLPPTSQPDVYPAAPARVIGRNVGDQIAAGLGIMPSSAGRVDPGALGITPVTAVSGAGFTGYSSGLAAVAQPKLTVAAANVAAPAAGYVALAAGGRSAPFAVAPELVGGSSALAGMQYPSSTPIVSASPYLRTLPGVMDAASIAAVDPATMMASQQLKYIPYQSQGRDLSMVGAPSASGLYPLQPVMQTDTVGAGYALVNSGGAVKRPLNDVMLYMVDKRPRYY